MWHCALKQTSETIVSFCKYLFNKHRLFVLHHYSENQLQHVLAFLWFTSRISYPWIQDPQSVRNLDILDIWGFWILRISDSEKFWSWGFFKPQILKIATVVNAAGKSHFNPCFVHFQFQILWQPFPCVRNLLNKNIWFFSFVFAAPPVISRRSHTLRRRAVGQIFPHGQELWSQGGKFDSLWTSVVGEELLPGRGTWLQSEWMSTSQVLEFAAGTVEKYLYTTWFAIPLGGF